MTSQLETATDPIRPLVEVRNLEITYRRPGWRKSPVHAVRGVDATISGGQSVGLVGESGSGKSTIGAAILGLAEVTGGSINFDGRDVTERSSEDRQQLARRMQVVFQDPYGSMNPARTIGDTVTESLRYNLGLSADEIDARLTRALTDVGIDPQAALRYPAQFSGGQRQRIAIARALVMEPDFIVCDEPTSALDLSVQAQIINLLARLKKSRGLSYLFISHDLSVVQHICDEILVLYAGRVVEHGPAAEIAARPVHPYTRALLAAAPVPDPKVQRARSEVRRSSAGASRTRTGASTAPGCSFAPRCPHALPACTQAVPDLVRYDNVEVRCIRVGEIPMADIPAASSGDRRARLSPLSGSS